MHPEVDWCNESSCIITQLAVINLYPLCFIYLPFPVILKQIPDTQNRITVRETGQLGFPAHLYVDRFSFKLNFTLSFWM